MQKIGLSKCKDIDMKYANTYIKNIFIKIQNNDIVKINSSIINSNIIDVTYSNKTSSIKVLISLNIKIIYQSSNNSVYIEEQNCHTVSYIDLPNNIEGNNTYTLYLQKKIKPKIHVENICATKISDSKILVNFYLIINLEIPKSYFLAYNINNHISDNIFISFSNGENIVQKTFTYDIDYQNIKWRPNSLNLVLTSIKENLTYFNILDANNNVISNIPIEGFVNNYDFIDQNTVVFDLSKDTISSIHTLNLKNNNTKRISTYNISDKYFKPYYNKSNKKIYFLCSIDNKNCLANMDLKGNFDFVFNHSHVYDYRISNNGDKILLKIKKQEKYYLFILDTKTNAIDPVHLNFEYDKILKFDLYNNNYICNILILVTMNENTFLIKYDTNCFQSEKISNSNKVIDFSIDYSTNIIYLCTMENNLSKISAISSSKEDVILRLPSEIKSLVCRY